MRARHILVVTFLSAGTLAYEILLVRVFAVQHFDHFAYMAIGVAMLGFGVSGTIVAAAKDFSEHVANAGISWSSSLAAVTLIVGTAAALRMPMDPTQLPWDATQWYRLGVVYVLLALPFGTAAMAIVLALTLTPRPGMVYGASFFGSGLGAASSITALWILSPQRALAVPALLCSVGALVAAHPARANTTRLTAAVITAVLAVLAGFHPPWSLTASPYKALPQVQAYPGARRLAERSSPVGWVVAVAAPAFRYAPGLSLGFQGDFPTQIGLFVDGQIAGAITDEDQAAPMLDWLPTAAPYAVSGADDVLALGAGGGLEIQNALAHGARHVTAVELQPDAVELARALGPLGTEAANVDWVVGDARSFAARTRQKYDLIVLAPTGGIGGAAAGVFSQQQDFLHTVDAYASYLRCLDGTGILAVTQWLSVPVRQSARTVLTAGEALRRVAPQEAARGLVVLRSWGTATVLVKPAGFEPGQVRSLTSWATARLFDVAWYPGLERPITRFHHVDQPTLFEAARAAAAGPGVAADFAASYPFDIAPVSDANPYPHHFLRLGSVAQLIGGDRGAWLPFTEWGQVALVATLAQSVLLAGMFMVLPAALRHRHRGVTPRLVLVGYFAAIGFAYLAAEMAAIQQLALLLGHPVYAVAAVLTVFLLCSGIGSALSDRVDAMRSSATAYVLAAALVLCSVGLLHVVHLFQGTHMLLRVVVAGLALGPLATLMGLPFPLGLRALASGSSGNVAWAWAANGFASAVGAPLAALLSLQSGSPQLFVFAALAYCSAGVLAYLATLPARRSAAVNSVPASA